MAVRCAANWAAAVVSLGFLLPVSALWADNVTLRSADGTTAIAGRLLGFDGEFYRLDSGFGILTLDGARLSCDGAGCPDPAAFVAEVTFAGARAMGAVLMPALVEGFAVRNGLSLTRDTDAPGRFTYALRSRREDRVVARFHFKLSDPAEGFADLLTETADVVLSTREILPAEAALARQAGAGDLTAARHARIVGLDALVPLVPVSNRLRGIAMSDLARVLSGDVTDWADLGAPPSPISLHLPAAALGYDAMLSEMADVPRLSANAVRHETTQGVAAAVAADPSALGVGAYSERGNAEALPIVGPCGAVAAASRQSLKTEDYPLTAPLFAYTPARRLPPLARAFLAYASAPAAQPVVRRAGYVDQLPEPVPLDAQGQRLAAAIASAGTDVGLRDLQQMVAALTGLERLTVTFRFEGGASTPDAQSRSNVEFLAEALDRGLYDGRRLMFAGFSDGQGPAATNRRLAGARAEAVRDAVAAAADLRGARPPVLQAAAFGEAMPMACDETAWGRRINRRVEVWVE